MSANSAQKLQCVTLHNNFNVLSADLWNSLFSGKALNCLFWLVVKLGDLPFSHIIDFLTFVLEKRSLTEYCLTTIQTVKMPLRVTKVICRPSLNSSIFFFFFKFFFKTYDLRKIGNIRKISKLHWIIVYCLVLLLKWKFCQY